jgi:T5SS/PEP-CTERM-associated repeat protein
LNASWFAIGNNGGSGVVTIDHSTVNLDGVVFFNGDPIGAAVRVGRGVGANGALTLQNGAVINIDNSIANSSVILGGTSALAGGSGTLTMTGGSAINFTGSAASASLQVGGVSGTGSMTMAGNSTVNVGATGSVLVASTAGSAGNLTIGGGSVVSANNVGIGGNSDTAAGGVGNVVLTGPGSRLQASGDAGFVAVGRSGTGTLVVSDQATLAATIINVGRATGGTGTLTVDNATVALSGQQAGGSGAGISIGNRGGSGTATILNGSQVTITNMGTGGASLNVGGTPSNPLGTGTLDVSGGSQINLVAQPGLAAVRVGHDGTGTATFTGSTLNVGGGSVTIAGATGSTGTMTLNAGSVVNAGYVGVGATPTGPGGNGRLVLNDNSTVNTTTFEIGPSGVLSGSGGTLHATGDVIVAGTISPGNSPGHLIIDCNIVSLDGSMLIMDVLAVGPGYDIDRLIIGSGSTFDLSHLQIVFNFLGDTDPNLFAASGGFDLDNFLRSGLDDGSDVGLSAAFAPGEAWNDIVDPSRIAAVSSVFDVTDLRLQADGSLEVTTAAIPEPSTWASMLLGLLGFGAWVRRRRGRAMTTPLERRSATSSPAPLAAFGAC